MFTLLFGTTLSIFCKISSETSFSELISGTTSSCNATFLNWMLDCTAATPLVTPVVTVALLKVLTGTGISCPFAMIAFLLLLVKTVGREIVLKSSSGIQQMDDVGERSFRPRDKYSFASGGISCELD